jgi:hypothetical protein
VTQLGWGLSLDAPAVGLDPQLRSVGQSGDVLCALGLVATLYIPHGDRPAVRDGMRWAYERARQLVGRDYTWGADPTTGEPQAVAGSLLGEVRAWPPRWLNLFDLWMIFHGGAAVDDADAHSFLAVSRDRDDDELSILSVSFPLSWAREHTPDDFVAWVLELCALVGPSFGYAGPAILAQRQAVHVDPEGARAIYPLAKQYRGLEIDFPVVHEAYLRGRDEIKGVNWLTVLGSPWEATLGGRDALVSSLQPVASCLRFQSPGTGAEGLVIRAGVAPQLGDVATRERMPAYEHVARRLAPVLSPNPAVVWPQGSEVFSFQDAAAWMTRFTR